jgi:hypothetical protein
LLGKLALTLGKPWESSLQKLANNAGSGPPQPNNAVRSRTWRRFAFLIMSGIRRLEALWKQEGAKPCAVLHGDSLWVWSHLGPFAGFVLLGWLWLRCRRLSKVCRAAAWASVGLARTAATLASAASLQVVDGVALKTMVDHWATASAEARALAFEAAFAVRQIETGLARLFSVLSVSPRSRSAPPSCRALAILRGSAWRAWRLLSRCWRPALHRLPPDSRGLP